MGRAYQNRKDSMAKTSDAKAKVYSKYGREIYVCAKAGGVDPDGNLALRGLIDRAKKDQVPTHVIEKAIDKAKGGGGEDFSPARYEGFGPGGSMVIVDCLTDNPNRTFGDVRQCFTKTKCKIGTQGTVSHMFDHAAILAFKNDDEDAGLCFSKTPAMTSGKCCYFLLNHCLTTGQPRVSHCSWAKTAAFLPCFANTFR